MSDNYSLIIKNGNCYINGKLTKIDIGKVNLESNVHYTTEKVTYI